MLAYTYLEKGTFRLTDKPKPVLREPGDALVRVTLSSICTSDLHIKHGSVPRAVPGITVGLSLIHILTSTSSPEATKSMTLGRERERRSSAV